MYKYIFSSKQCFVNYKNNLLTGLPRCASTVKAPYPVNAGSSVEASGTRAIIDVNRAIRAGPAVHAYTRKSTYAVGASGAVLTNRWSQRALVHVLFAKSARVSRRATAGVAIDAVDARCSVLTLVTWTIVNIFFAVLASETCK